MMSTWRRTLQRISSFREPFVPGESRMARFSADQAADITAIQQVVNELGDELDRNDGLKMLDADGHWRISQFDSGQTFRRG